MTDKAGPALLLSDEIGTMRAGLTASKNGPVLELDDETGRGALTW